MALKCNRCKVAGSGTVRCLVKDRDGYCLVFQCKSCGAVWVASNVEEKLMDGDECEE